MKTQHAVYSFLCGAAIGAAIALLYAPQKGDKTRKKIGKAIEKEKEKITDMVGSIRPLVKNTKNEIEKAKENVEKAIAKEIKAVQSAIK